MPRRHLAVALLVPEPARTEIDALRRALGDPDITRIPPHVTLVPPVNVRDEELPRVSEVLRDAAARTRPATLAIGPTATFLPRNPVLYLRVSGDVDAFAALHAALLAPPFERPREHDFVPHVTLRSPAPPEVVRQAAVLLGAYDTTVLVDRVYLLEHSEHRWRPIADATFAPPAIVGRGSLPVALDESELLDPEAAAFVTREWRAHDEQQYGTTRWERDPWAITARRDGKVLGAATGWTGLGVAYLSELIVASRARREGIGSHLLAAFDALATRRDCSRRALRSEASSPARRFYEARGWWVEATFTDWLGGRDYVQMRR